MVVVEAKLGMRLAWDMFLEDKKRLDHIERFQETEWKQIRREARDNFALELSEDVLPHWVDSGKAVYWQHYFLTERVEEKVDGVKQMVPKEVDKGWHPTGPLPANNASQIAHYLHKGFRLRPPTDAVVAVDVEVLEDAVPTEGEPEHEQGHDGEGDFACSVAHYGRPFRGTHRFKTWAGYVQHCDQFKVPVQESPPVEVVARRTTFKWFCILHDVGWDALKGVSRHVNGYLRRGKSHVPVEKMKVAHADEGGPNNGERSPEGGVGAASPVASTVNTVPSVQRK